MKFIAGFIELMSFWQKWKHYVQMNLLHMQIFHKNKDGRSKDQKVLVRFSRSEY